MSEFGRKKRPRGRTKQPSTDLLSTSNTTESLPALQLRRPGPETASFLTFPKRKGFAKIDGQQFEWNLAALLFIRGLKSNMDFQLATNVDGAGEMDDVVFRFKPPTEPDAWTTVYVQLKHLETKNVTRKMLKRSKEAFNLKKYFESFLKIKNTMSIAKEGERSKEQTLFDGSFEKSVFVIFTNAVASEFLGSARYGRLCQAEDFVWCGFGQVFNFQDDEELLLSLGECGEEGNVFLGRLQLFSGQPSAQGLEAVIERELQNVDAKIIEGVDFRSLFQCFLRRIQIWWEQSNEILHRGNDLLRSSVLEIISMQTVKRYALDLVFEEAALKEMKDSLKGDCKVSLVKSSESSCQLSMTKLCQVFGGQSLVLDCESLLANEEALLLQWRKEEVKSLIICTNGWDSSHQKDYCRVVNELLEIPNSLPIVFLTNDETDVFGALTVAFQVSITSCDDQFTFLQLNVASQKQVLDKELSFQGHLTTLSALLQGSLKSADRVLDARSVVEILVSEGILSLGSAFDDGIGHYVDRHLEQATVVKTSVLQDGALLDSVTVRVMQCEASDSALDIDLEDDFGITEGFGGMSSEFSRALATKNDRTLFGKAVHLLSSLSNKGHDDKIVSSLSESLMVADEDNCDFFIGPKFPLGLFECSSVGLRVGQEDAVTALWVRTSKHSSPAGFLFVSDKTSEHNVKKLSDFHQSKHLLSLKEGQLRWIESRGDIESIRPHIDEDQILTFSPEKVTDVEDRLVLVCAEPGMGKSTLMARLAKNTKEAHPDYFVFLIALFDHSVLFAQDKHKDILGFLCHANKIESHLHRSLLKYALEVSGDVIVLFDGYDEIAPKYVEQSCDLLSRLMNETKTRKIWMTSRNSIKIALEDKTYKFSAKLREFNRADQESFLRKFLARKSNLLEVEFYQFINQLIEKTSQLVRDNATNFMGIPLQTQMLAEVYEDHVTGATGTIELPDNLDLLVLLEQIVDKKCGIYVRNRLKLSPESPLYENQMKFYRENFSKRHAKAALILLLSVEDFEMLSMQSVIVECSDFFKEIQNGSFESGFIDTIENDKPHFIHRLYAEYFIAKWMSKLFSRKRELVMSKLFTPNFAVVRNLFDRILAKDRPLSTAVINEDLEQTRALLEHEDIDAKDTGGRTALHLAASLGTNRSREENTGLGKILDLLIGKTSDFNQVDDVLGGSPFKYADVTRSWVAIDRFILCTDNYSQFALTIQEVVNGSKLDTIFDLDLHNLMGLCLDNGLDVEHCSEGKRRLLYLACELGSVKVASLLIERNANINTVEKQYSPLLNRKIDYRYDSLVHAASANGHIDILKLLIQHQEQSNLVNYINMKDETGSTPVHLAALYGHLEAINFLVRLSGNVRSRNHHNSTPLHLAAELKHPEALRVLLEALDESARADAVNACDNDGDSVLTCGAIGGCLECVKQIVTNGGKLTGTNKKKCTPLMVAAQNGHREVGSYLLANFNEATEAMRVVEYINMANENDFRALEFALTGGHSAFVSLMISQAGGLDTKDGRFISLFHIPALLQHPGTLMVLLNAIDESERAAIVNCNDDNNKSAFWYGISGGCLECVEILVKAGGKMSQQNHKKQTPLMLAVDKRHSEVVNYLLQNFNEDSEGMSLQQYVNMVSNDDWSAIRLATHYGNPDIISNLLLHGGNPLCTNRYNCTSLHMAAQQKSPDALKVLLDAISQADRAKMVNKCDKNGESVLLHGAIGGCVECVRMIYEAGGRMTLASNNGLTPLFSATEGCHLEVVSYLLHNFNADRERVRLKEHINIVGGEDGLAIIHIAAQEGLADLISILINLGCNTQILSNRNALALHLAAAFKHCSSVRVLLDALSEADRAAAVNSCDIDGYTVLTCAVFGGCVECVRLVVQAGGKITHVDNDGLTALMIAVCLDNLEIVNYLLNNIDAERDGISRVDFIRITNKNELNAIDCAASKGNLEILRSLLMAYRTPLEVSQESIDNIECCRGGEAVESPVIHSQVVTDAAEISKSKSCCGCCQLL